VALGIKSENMINAAIKSVAGYAPENIIQNHQIEDKIILAHSDKDKNGILKRLFGSETRRFACIDTQVSDLACKAAHKILQFHDPESIDLLIFAAASSDLIEPATANIIQSKLGLNCPSMDIKNACNSFMNAMQVATAFIQSDCYSNVLIVCGEKLSEVINYYPRDYEHFVKCLAGYSLGDAGAAMLIGKADTGRIVYQDFKTFGKHWDLCTVKGGGSLAYRDLDSYYFESDSRELQLIFSEYTLDFVNSSLKEVGWKKSDINWVVSHQIAGRTTSKVAKYLGIPEQRFANIFSKYGNIAAATIPMALSEVVDQGKLHSGDKVMLLGFAAGVSISVQFIEW